MLPAYSVAGFGRVLLSGTEFRTLCVEGGSTELRGEAEDKKSGAKLASNDLKA